MPVNRLIYGAWGLILLGAVAIAGYNLKPHAGDRESQAVESPATGTVSDAGLQLAEFEQDQVPGRLPVVSDQDPLADTKLKTLRRIVSEEMPSASAEEVKIWTNEFQDLPEEAVRFLLRQKRESDGDTPSVAEVPQIDIPAPIAVNMGSTPAALAEARSVVVGNLINSATVGFRRKLVEFTGLDDKYGTGLGIAEVRFQMTPGPLSNSGNTFDIALETPGFFAVLDGERELFTRVGRFKLNDEQRLVTSHGWQVLGVKEIPEGVTNVEISEAGDVTAVVDGMDHELGKLRVATFLDSSRLRSADGCFFEPTAASGHAQYAQRYAVKQGWIEGSNADSRRERAMLQQLEEWDSLVPGR